MTTKSESEASVESESAPTRDLDFLSEDDVERIILAWRKTRARISLVLRLVVTVFFVFVAYMILSDIPRFTYVLATTLLAILVFVQLNVRYPVLMGFLYFVLAILGLAIYAGPYRLVRKTLRVVDGGKVKTLGRVVFIRGVGANGRPVIGFTYLLWYTYRILRRAIARDKRPYSESLPGPHEIPFGDPYYLLGNKTRGIEQFKNVIIYQSNAIKWIARRLHTTSLYTTCSIETSPFLVRVIGDGANVLEFSRATIESSVHQEFSKKPLTYFERDAFKYRQVVEESLLVSSGYVDRGVKSDASLAKRAIERFVLPSSERILGEALADVEKEEADEDAKRKEKKK